MLVLMIMYLLLAQAAAYAPPPAPSIPGKESLEMRLHGQCISEEGIKLIVERWVRDQAAGNARLPQIRKNEEAVANAAYNNPVDVAALERGLLEQARQSGQAAQRIAESSIENLRQLSTQDRAIYARNLTTMRPATPPKRCSVITPR
jgi:hypothetical protein